MTLGKFDGLHRGHQVLTEELFAAGKDGLKTVVFTFGTHPRAKMEGKAEELLMTSEEKRNYLEARGLDVLIEYPFNDETCRISAEDFVRKVLVGQLQAKYTAPELVGKLAHAAGLIPEYAPVTPEQLISLFSWDKVPKGDLIRPEL